MTLSMIYVLSLDSMVSFRCFVDGLAIAAVPNPVHDVV